MTGPAPGAPEPDDRKGLRGERWDLLGQVSAATSKPMTALAFVWLGLLILDFTRGLGPALRALSNGIWALFGLDFAVKFAIAPRKLPFLRSNWPTALSLLLPAFRTLRVLRAFRFLKAARAARSVGLLRLATALNRGMRALSAAVGRRGVGYVVALTILVAFAGAAGMYQFESPASLRREGFGEAARQGGGLRSYGEAVWWTAMIMTTMGSDYWPKTLEGRVLCWALSLYAFAVFGYITATIASLFIALGPEPGGPGASTAELAALREEVATLSRRVAALADALDRPTAPDDRCR